MNGTAIPEQLRDTVLQVGDSVSAADVDTYGRLREIEDKSYKLRTVLAAWERQQEQERDLRRTYATWLLGGLFVQALLLNVSFFLIGLDKLQVERWVAVTFIAAAFSEIAAATLIVVRSLFPEKAAGFLSLIERL